ncbi:MAG: hypothetical protein DMG96_36215 [Acidobacteria bacterium]|nr:MAG: hypothetical protein DMG96_36215 [Acidobacteriota bacterium]
MKLTSIALLLLTVSGWAMAQVKQGRLASGTSYSNATLGFRYTPPNQMHDKTERSRAEIQSRAAALHTGKMFDLLLAMSSGPDDTAPDWHSLTIESYPRSAVSDREDFKAEGKMNAWVAHSRDASALPRPVDISGQSFAVSVFGMQEGTIRKGASVWTTVRKGKLLSFAFVANSPEQLKRLTETMKSLQFF